MKNTRQELQAEIEELRSRLEIAEETLNAICSGEVDALIVNGKDGQQIYTLTGADRTYRLLLESMSEGAVTLNPDGFIIYCNPFFAKLLKTPLDKLVGAPMLDFVPQSQRQKFLSLLERCSRGEFKFRAADHAFLPVYVSANMLPAESGQKLTCLIVTDLREQKRDEKIIAEAKLSQLIFQQATEAIIICDAEGKIIRASNAANRLCGQNPLFRHFDDILPLIFINGKSFSIAKSLLKPALQNIEVDLPADSGKVLNLILSSAQLKAENGLVIGCVITLIDITERIRAERSLKQSEHRYRILSESIPAMLWTNTPDGRTVDNNLRWYEYTGQNHDQATQGGWKELIHPDDIEHVIERWSHSMRTGERYQTECRIRRALDGQFCWHLVQAIPSYDQGSIIAWYGAAIEIDEKKRAENALLESEERLRMVLEANTMGIFEYDLQTGETHWNSVEYELLGLSPGEAPAGPEEFFSFVHPEDIELVRANWKKAQHTGILKTEFRIIRADGQVRWLMGKGQFSSKSKAAENSPDADRQELRFLGINFDITEQKHAEQELFNTQQRLLALLQALPVGVSFSNDASCSIITGNRAALEQFEIGLDDNLSASAPNEQAKGRQMKFFHHGRPLAENELPLQRAVAEKRYISDMELEILLPSGRRWFANASGAPIYDRSGAVIAGVAVTVDITQSKLAEKALRESEEQFRMMANAMAQMAWIAKPDGSRYWFNQRWYEYTGSTLEQVEGWKWQSYHEPKTSVKTMTDYIQAMSSGNYLNTECSIRRSDGQYRQFLTRAIPLKNSAGEIVRWFGTSTDITDIKVYEQSMQSSLLEKEVLLKEIHHRVKNNLQVISSLLDLQSETLDDLELQKHFHDVRDRVRSMAMVHEKLYQTENMARIDFAEYAGSLATYLWRTHAADAASVQLKQFLHKVLLSVEVAVPLGLILNELITNALKHAFHDRAEGEVTLALHVDNKGLVCLRVSDNGIGLPEGFKWQESHTLGLRLVHMLIEQLKGTAEISAIGGTEFRISFHAPEAKKN